MGRLPITLFDFQLMHSTSHRLQLFYLGAKAFSGREIFIELSDLFTQDADFLLQNFACLFSCLTGLLGPPEFIHLYSNARIKLTNPLIAFHEDLFELLNPATMSGLPITEFDFQKMDAILCGLELRHLGTQVVPVGEALVELRYMLPQDPDFLIQDLPGLLASAKFVSLSSDDRIKLTHLLLYCAFISFQVRQSPRPDCQFCFECLQLLAAGHQLSLG